MKDIVVTARIDGQTHKGLRRLAERDDRSISYLLRKAAEQYVSEAHVSKTKAARKEGQDATQGSSVTLRGKSGWCSADATGTPITRQMRAESEKASR